MAAYACSDALNPTFDLCSGVQNAVAQIVAKRRTVQAGSEYIHLGALIFDQLGTLLMVQTCIQDVALFADGKQWVLLRIVEVFLRSRSHSS